MRAVPLATAVFLGALLLPATPAQASCAEGSGPQGSPVIFVGTATAERRGFTRFDVEEVRAGPDLAPEVWVLSGQEQAPWPLNAGGVVGSSTDAQLVPGERYVVGASRRFDTSVCTIAEATDVANGSPGRDPVTGGSSGADPPLGPGGQTLWVGGVVAAIGSAVLLRRRRSRRTA